MPPSSEHTPTLLLERPEDGAGAVPDDLSDIQPWRPRHVSGRRPAQPAVPVPGREHLLAPPGMALLAAVCILEGYKWIGAIPAGDSRLSTIAFSRGGALVFTVLATAAAVTLVRADPEGSRTLSQRLVLPATAVLIASTVVLIASTGTLAKDILGIADLALASALAGALVAGERRRRSSRRGAPSRGDSADRALPVV